MCSDIAIKAVQLGKVYPVFDKPIDRLKQFFWKKRQFYKAFTALENVNLELKKGEILGIIGRNGSGKSTLLQLICSTLSATSGELEVNGRIAALLELGAGFNPEFTGRENVFFNASILGLEQEEIEARYDDIVEFSGVGEFIDQPVKTYSSGMYVRLAFSVAVSVDPDILVIDEALSVGDGTFARKSFDRIMSLKEAGKTILFCSHSLYHIEALCNKAIWLEKGQIKKQGSPADVAVSYNNFLERSIPQAEEKSVYHSVIKSSNTYFKEIKVSSDGHVNKRQILVSLQSDLLLSLRFSSDINKPSPSVGAVIHSADGRMISSVISTSKIPEIPRNTNGEGKIELQINKIPLLKGHYYIDAYLACENSIHIYEHAEHIAELEVRQDGLEQGLFAFEHKWKCD